MFARRLWSLGLILLLAGCLRTPLADERPEAPGAQEPPPRHSAVNEARSLYYFGISRLMLDNGEYREAAFILARAAAADPESLYLRQALATLLFDLGEYEEAQVVTEAALSHFGDAPELLLLMGNLHFNRGDEQDAIGYFERVVRLDPEQEAAHLHLAIGYARNDRIDAAVDLLRDFLLRQPESLAARLTLARLYREAGDVVLAIDTFTEILRQEPGFEPAVLELGNIYESQGGTDKALRLYRQTLAEHPYHLAIRHHLSSLLIQQDRLDEALGELQTIAEINPDDLDARRKVGLIQMDQRSWSAAAQTFADLLADHPELERIRFFLGSALERLDAWDEAIEVFAGIRPGSELYADALSHRSYLHYRAGRIDAAIDALEERLQHPELRPENYFFLASLHEAKNDLPAALEVIGRAAALFPADADLYYQRGLLYERMDDRPQALKSMRQAIEKDADHAEALNFLAYSHAEAGENLDQALLMAKRALDLKDAPHIVDTVGWVYYKLGRLPEARQAIEAASALLPNDAVVLEHLADIYRAMGLVEKAEASYRQVLELEPGNEGARQKLLNLQLGGDGR